MGRVLLWSGLASLALLVLGNAVIIAAWKLESTPAAAATPAIDVGNFRVVDDHLWRGAAPGARAYRQLAAAGVTTVVDLRAEDDLHLDTALLHDLGLRLVRLPIRDGQTPTAAEVRTFLAAVRDSDGPTFVHCGAGVGRTGTMVAAYLVTTGQTDGRGAVKANLGVGPPSLEQLAFAARLDPHDIDRPGTPIVVASRVLDAPRRIWSRLRS